MDESFPHWYSVISIEISDDVLKKRWAGVEEIANPSAPLQLINVFAGRTASAELITHVRNIFFKHDSSFRMSGNDQELKVLAGAIVAQCFKVNNNHALCMALALVCCTGGGLVTNLIVPEVFDRAQQALTNYALRARNSAVSTQPIPANSFAEAIQKLSQPTDITACAAIISDALKQINSQATALTELKNAHNLIAEEANILWWLFGQYSDSLGRPYSECTSAEAAIAAGYELAELTTTQIGPASIDGILQRLQSHTKDSGKVLSLGSILEKAPQKIRDKAISHLESKTLEFCPLHFGIAQWHQLDSLETAATVTLAKFKLTSEQTQTSSLWARQYFRECILLRNIAKNS